MNPFTIPLRCEKIIALRRSNFPTENRTTSAINSITIELDDATLIRVQRLAEDQGKSREEWIAQAVHEQVIAGWSQECVALAGRFPDFPLAPHLQDDDGQSR